MISTIFTTSGNLSVPRTLSIEKKEGSGKVFLDTTKTTFYPEWQSQLHTVFEFVKKFYEKDFHYDFLISMDCQAVNGWSTSISLFLLFSSLITGEPLPKNIFSTGCMFSPDGWISHGKFKATQVKIDASEAFVQYSGVENPQFLIPFSYHEYKSEKVRLHYVRSVFSALEVALPETFQKYKQQIEKLSHVKAQDNLQNVLEYIPSSGEAFVLVSADADQPPQVYSELDEGVLFIKEKVSSDPVYLYFIRDTMVMFKHFYDNQQKARTAAFQYQEVFHEKS